MIASEYELYRLFFQAFSNETRFHILQLLRDGPLSVGEIADQLGFEQSRVSHSLSCLLNCALLVVKAQGKKRTYRLNPQLISVLEGIDEHITHYGQRLQECEKMGPEGSLTAEKEVISCSAE
jgi:DNA-binding transcriptional ArsR family regulator